MYRGLQNLEVLEAQVSQKGLLLSQLVVVGFILALGTWQGGLIHVLVQVRYLLTSKGMQIVFFVLLITLGLSVQCQRNQGIIWNLSFTFRVFITFNCSFHLTMFGLMEQERKERKGNVRISYLLFGLLNEKGRKGKEKEGKRGKWRDQFILVQLNLVSL